MGLMLQNWTDLFLARDSTPLYSSSLTPEYFPGYSHTNTNDDDSALEKHDEIKTCEKLVADAGIELNLSMFKIQETAVFSHFAEFYE